jgi:hypothetical protein
MSELFLDKNELKTTLENREFGHNAPSATSQFSLADSSLLFCQWVGSVPIIKRAGAIH